jgi:hypothetical protein
MLSKKRRFIMTISSEIIASIIGGFGFLGSCASGLACSDGVRRMYQPILKVTNEYANTKDFVVPLRQGWVWVFGNKMPDTMEHFYLNMALINKVAHVSERAGLRSALFVGTIESVVAFFRSWQGSNERPWVVDIMEGGLRGSLMGCLASATLRQDKEYSGVQMVTGTVIGFVTGMLASFAGSVSGYIVKKVLDKSNTNPNK